MQPENQGIPFDGNKVTSAVLAGIFVGIIVATAYGWLTGLLFGQPQVPSANSDALRDVGALSYGGQAAAFTAFGAFVFVFFMRVGGQHAIRNFLIAAGIGLLLSFAILAQPGISTGDRLILGGGHVVTAAAVIPTMLHIYQRR